MEAFAKEKDKIKLILKHAKSNIHLSFDLWTSDNSLALLAVCAHFTDKHHQLRTIMLALRRIRGSHSGENIAQTLYHVIKEFEINERLGYFVLDNAESNDTCIEHLLLKIAPQLQKKHRRLRCMGHILNLACQALLFGDVPEQHQANVHLVRALQDEQRELNIWRKKGPIGKLHNVVRFIRNTPQRREAFMSITVGDTLTDTDFDHLMVKSDNATRWNSAHDMIHRALKLRRRIDIYCFDHKSSLEQDTLTSDDWTSLTALNEILEPFKRATINLQGRGASGSYGTAWEVLPTIHKLLRHVKEQKAQWLATALSAEFSTPESHHVFHSLTRCEEKLQKYENLCSQSPIYAAATVMNPLKKWSWFSQRRPLYKEVVEREVQQIWDDFYRNRPMTPPQSTPTPPAMASINTWIDSDTDSLDDEPQNQADSYTAYTQRPRVPGSQCSKSQIADWWRKNPQGDVARMAWDTLSIPAMSAECERIFSSAAHMVTYPRNGLQDDVIEAGECLKSWYTQGICEG